MNRLQKGKVGDVFFKIQRSILKVRKPNLHESCVLCVTWLTATTSMRPLFPRQTEINRLRSELERTGFPRLKMLLIVSITGIAGLLASYELLHAGIRSMALRYPLAVALAYLVFLFLLWLWLRTEASDYADLPDIPGSSSSSGHGSSLNCGDSAIDLPGDSGVVSETLGAVGQAEEFAIPLLVVLVAGAVLLSSLWVVYSAPVLFAELLVDGVLSASLYRRLRGLETQHWLTTAMRRTVWPFAITALVLCMGGAAIQHLKPDAVSIGNANTTPLPDSATHVCSAQNGFRSLPICDRHRRPAAYIHRLQGLSGITELTGLHISVVPSKVDTTFSGRL
jgi:hypothetical protein